MAELDLTKYLAKPEETLAQHTQAVENGAEHLFNCGYISKDVYCLLRTACHYHDYGKANPEFQNRIKNGHRFNAAMEIGHNILSLYFLNEKEFAQPEHYQIVANAILNHHHYVHNYNELDEIKRNIHDKGTILATLLAGFDTKDIRRKNIKEFKDIRSNPIAILVQGLLYKCDYSASAHLPIEFANNFLCNGLSNLLTKWQSHNPASRWNPLQEFCQSHTNENIVVIAQTGMGKTEAGLWWLGDNKGFYILPLKTAINAIYSRVCREILNDDSKDKVTLLHSDNVSYWLLGDNAPGGDQEEWDIEEYKNKSKQLSLPLTVSTPDQLFDFVFKYPGYELKQATLSYSKVIIDEIQAYSAEMLAYLVRGLEVINEMQGQFAILTATLPPYIKDKLSANMTFREGRFVDNSQRHHVQVVQDELRADGIGDFYRDNQQNGVSNKILVICNTVKKAQGVFNELKVQGIDNVFLLHGKFIRKHRAAKDQMILSDGQTYDYQGQFNSKSVIWVATQVVEASLDIDFDYLFTELSDLNSLFQRLGRCNRKGKKSVHLANCFVFTEIDQGILTNPQGNRGFIDSGLYYVSKKALDEVAGVLREDEKLRLIDTYLTTENLKNAASHIITDFNEHYGYIKGLYIGEADRDDVNRRFRNIISYDIIPRSVYEEYREEIEGAQKVLSEKPSYRERIVQQNIIKDFTVSVGYYDIYIGGKKNSAVCRDLGDNGKVNLNKYTEILIVDCHYDEERGFMRLTREEFTARNQGKVNDYEDVYDSFI